MDNLIQNGDFALDVCGLQKPIDSIDEACQRVLFTMSVKRGSYPYNRLLGCDFSSLKNDENIEKTALLLCREAISNQSEISIDSVAVTENQDNTYHLTINLSYSNRCKKVEVDVNADI